MAFGLVLPDGPLEFDTREQLQHLGNATYSRAIKVTTHLAEVAKAALKGAVEVA